MNDKELYQAILTDPYHSYLLEQEWLKEINEGIVEVITDEDIVDMAEYYENEGRNEE